MNYYYYFFFPLFALHSIKSLKRKKQHKFRFVSLHLHEDEHKMMWQMSFILINGFINKNKRDFNGDDYSPSIFNGD